MTILLTGATGFVGRQVLRLLLEEGHNVISLIRKTSTGENANVRLKTVNVDLANGTGFDQVPWADIDVVIHLASSGVKAAHRVWADAISVNVVGTQRLLTSVVQRAVRVPKVFLARTFYEHLTDKMPALLENPYIATKQAGSGLALDWARGYPGTLILGTFFQVYGPGDDAGNVLSYAARELKAGRPATFGSGRGLRDWIYITDAAAAVVAAVKMEGSGVQEVDIGSGVLVSIREMIERLVAVAGIADSTLEFDASRDRRDMDMTLCAHQPVPGWQPSVSTDQGLLKLFTNL